MTELFSEQQIASTIRDPGILLDEVDATLLSIKDVEALGKNEAQSSITNLFDEDFKKELTIIFSEIYKSRKVRRELTIYCVT